jgi:hypothetical protein
VCFDSNSSAKAKLARRASMAEGGKRVRVRGREGEEVVWSRKAARRAGRLNDWLDDLDPSEDDIFPVEETAAPVLRTLGAMCDDNWSASYLDKCSLHELATLIEGASNLLAEQALEYAQVAFACLLDDKRANALRELLGAVDDFESDEERAAALAEPAFTPDSPTSQHAAAGAPALAVNDDAAEAAMAKVGMGTLIELKGVNRAWRALGRRELCSRLCGRKGHADPRQLDEITELHVELLIEAGRPWEAARAGRLVPHLEQLTGYGFVVDVAAVRKVNLDDDGGEEEEEEEEEELRLLSAAVQAALRHCCTGEGEPPRALLLAAIACAGSGSVCGIPVEAMRADTLAVLDLYDYWTGPEGAMLIAYLVPVMGALTSLDLSRNQLCGLDHNGRGTYTAEGITAIADALRVNGALTSVKLRLNKLGDEGWGAIFAAICGNKDSKIMSIDASYENIGPAGVELIAAALRTSVTGALTRVDVRLNNIVGDGAVQLSAAVLGNLKIEMFNEIPIKEMRADSFTELDLNGKGVGVEGGMVVAGLIPVMGALTSLNLSSNNLCSVTETGYIKASQVQGSSFNEGDKVVYLGKEMIVSKAIDRDGDIKMTNLPLMSGLNALANALRVNGALTMCDLRDNYVGEEGKAFIRNAAEGKAGFKLHL